MTNETIPTKMQFQQMLRSVQGFWFHEKLVLVMTYVEDFEYVK